MDHTDVCSAWTWGWGRRVRRCVRSTANCRDQRTARSLRPARNHSLFFPSPKAVSDRRQREVSPEPQVYRNTEGLSKATQIVTTLRCPHTVHSKYNVNVEVTTMRYKRPGDMLDKVRATSAPLQPLPTHSTFLSICCKNPAAEIVWESPRHMFMSGIISGLWNGLGSLPVFLVK